MSKKRHSWIFKPYSQREATCKKCGAKYELVPVIGKRGGQIDELRIQIPGHEVVVVGGRKKHKMPECIDEKKGIEMKHIKNPTIEAAKRHFEKKIIHCEICIFFLPEKNECEKNNLEVKSDHWCRYAISVHAKKNEQSL